MKILVNGTWWVATGFGGIAHTQSYEQACKIERSVVRAMIWGAGLSLAVIVIAVIAVVLIKYD